MKLSQKQIEEIKKKEREYLEKKYRGFTKFEKFVHSIDYSFFPISASFLLVILSLIMLNVPKIILIPIIFLFLLFLLFINIFPERRKLDERVRMNLNGNI